MIIKKILKIVTKRHNTSFLRSLGIAAFRCVLILATHVSVLTAATLPSARSLAMGGAYTSLARGVDAARYNPANLGFASHQQRGVEFIGIGVNISNNAFSLNDYNNYTGAVLSTEDKAEILGKIPEDGLNLAADVEATALAVSYGQFVFQSSGVGEADVNLNKDILELVLEGNTVGQQVEMTGSYSDAVGYVSFGLSYGQPVYTSGTRQLSVGGTVKYLRGLGVEQIVELEGAANTLVTGFTGQGRIIARTAEGGSGYAVDLGAALRLDDSYTAGVRVSNFLSSISWSNNTEEHGYLFEFDTMTVDNMGDDFVVSDDYSIDIDNFSTSLPSSMNVGFAKTSGQFLWAVDWQQGFRRGAGASTKPRLSVGGEYWLISQLPLRAGVATGGNRYTGFSMGTGFYSAGFHLDLAVVTGTSVTVYSAKGLHFAVSTGLQF
jgi:hypothetical protein